MNDIELKAKRHAKSLNLRCPVRAFKLQRFAAARRGIPWEMTFEEWWGFWATWYHARGAGKNALCMGRNNDIGPYRIGNVYLTTNLGNALDRGKQRRNESDDERIARQRKANLWCSARIGHEATPWFRDENYCKPEKLDLE